MSKIRIFFILNVNFRIFIIIKDIGLKNSFFIKFNIHFNGINKTKKNFFSILIQYNPILIIYLLINTRYIIAPAIIPIKIYNLNTPLLKIKIDLARDLIRIMPA